MLTIKLRSFLRFLHAQGETPHDFTAAIPTVRRWAQPDVPKKLTSEELDRVLDTPDRATAMGRRDYAILLLLARLGLRAGEVILLELKDIHWRTGEILIRGKGGRKDLLPLPRDVGIAIARYLRLDRGSRATQRIFLRTRSPRVPLSGPAPIGYVGCWWGLASCSQCGSSCTDSDTSTTSSIKGGAPSPYGRTLATAFLSRRWHTQIMTTRSADFRQAASSPRLSKSHSLPADYAASNLMPRGWVGGACFGLFLR